MMHDSPCSKKRSLNLNVNFKPGEKTLFSCINTRPSCPVLLASNYIMWRLTSCRVCLEQFLPLPDSACRCLFEEKKNQKDLCHNKTAAVSAEKMIFGGGFIEPAPGSHSPPFACGVRFEPIKPRGWSAWDSHMCWALLRVHRLLRVGCVSNTLNLIVTADGSHLGFGLLLRPLEKLL